MILAEQMTYQDADVFPAEIDCYGSTKLRCSSCHENFFIILIKTVKNASSCECIPVYHAHTQVLVLVHEELPAPIQ
jgi:hypothetical protein